MAQPAAAAAPPSEGGPVDDHRAYRKALGTFATGLTVVTTLAAGGRPLGLTVNSFTSVSLEPPLVSWCLEVTALSVDAFKAAPRFAVNVLAADQEDLVQHFARRTLDKFDGIATLEGLGGVPLLEGVVARFECRTVAVHPGGDHLIFIGEVDRYVRFDGEPLVFALGRYGRFTDG
jgi:3-hydroxy-9,10-secoandrosta-1,3,5(10)-triene-9,17-dione monooxygenase reductase component